MISIPQVRRFLEVTLTDYRNKWIQHLSYRMCVQCCCGWPCETHNAVQCSYDQCLHFLNLDECIANKIVCCEHRRVKTSRYRKWFPVPKPICECEFYCHVSSGFVCCMPRGRKSMDDRFIAINIIVIQQKLKAEPKRSLAHLCMCYYYISLHNNLEIYAQSA